MVLIYFPYPNFISDFITSCTWHFLHFAWS